MTTVTKLSCHYSKTPQCHFSVEARYVGFSIREAILLKIYDESSHQISDEWASELVVARWPIFQAAPSSDHKWMGSEVK
jgi:hypothetical protein